MDNSKPKPFLGLTRKILSLLVRLYLLCLTPLAFFQRSLIYHPSRCKPLIASEYAFPQAVVDVTVTASDGLELHGWLALSGTSHQSPVTDINQSLGSTLPVVLYFSGNAGNRSMRSHPMSILAGMHAHVLLVDYRGYGENPGRPGEREFARDARAVWNYATRELKISPKRIVIYGESLGGGVATRLASELCLEGIEPGGLIVQSTFSSLVAVGEAHFPIVPVSLLLVERYPSDERIPQVTCPILQIHGARDSIVPFEIGQRLFDAAPAKSSSGQPKRQVVVSRADHNDIFDSNADRKPLFDELRLFLNGVHDRAKDSAEIPVSKSNQLPLTTKDDQGVPVDWSIIISLLLVVIVLVIWRAERVRTGKLKRGGQNDPSTTSP